MVFLGTPLSILILGGTRFVGRALVDFCISQDHRVTLFNRGLTNPGLFPDIETVVGDRTESSAFTALTGRTFDIVIDVAAYTPQVVGTAVQALAGHTDRYVFVSTRSVYVDNGSAHDETSDVLQLDQTLPADQSSYGARKAASEQVVLQALGDRALIVRPGMIVGPHDRKDRFAYWPRRFARGGHIIAPGSPTDLLQWIDVRDLSTWTIAAAAADRTGIYNIVGDPLPMDDFTAACRTVTGSDADLAWIPTAELRAAGFTPATATPLWIASIDVINVHKARNTGLHTRPLRETLTDILQWDTGRGGPPPGHEGLTATNEASLTSLARSLGSAAPPR